MTTITIDGMDEHDFRHAIEDMLRRDEGEEAIAKLRELLEPYARRGKILPRGFLDVSWRHVEFAGWHKLSDRLLHHDRPGHPISAIGVVMSAARKLGGPGPSKRRLSPFIKTFYFSDEAYPFTGASREDLLDGYSRDGFGWQGDYQATDATLSIRGIDELYGAIVELEERLFDSDDPPEDEIRAGSIGACYLAALMHQSLRETIRARGLPRPLCVLSACDGVYPFFDAPVAGQDEHALSAPAKPGADAEWSDDDGNAVSPRSAGSPGEFSSGEASLLDCVSRKGTKSPVLILDEETSRDAARFTEMAEAKRMAVDDDSRFNGLLPRAPRAEKDHPFGPAAGPCSSDDPPPWELNGAIAADFPDEMEFPSDLPDPLAPVGVEVFAPPAPAATISSGNSFRARVQPTLADEKGTGRDWKTAVLDWIRRMVLRS